MFVYLFIYLAILVIYLCDIMWDRCLLMLVKYYHTDNSDYINLS